MNNISYVKNEVCQLHMKNAMNTIIVLHVFIAWRKIENILSFHHPLKFPWCYNMPPMMWELLNTVHLIRCHLTLASFQSIDNFFWKSKLYHTFFPLLLAWHLNQTVISHESMEKRTLQHCLSHLNNFYCMTTEPGQIFVCFLW